MNNNNTNDLSRKVDFLLDVVNLLDVNGFLPSKLVERSRNRIKMERIREQIKELNPNDSQEKINELEKELKKCFNKEIDLERFFKKMNRNKFIKKFLQKICG